MNKGILGKSLAVVSCVIALFCALITFSACKSDDMVGDFYYRLRDDGTVAVYVEQYDMEELDIPETIAGLKVTSVMKPKSAQKVNTTLTKVVLPETVRWIEKNAFKGCAALEEINFPEHLASIGESAFQNCSSLITVNLPDGVTSLGSYAFSGCMSLQDAYVPSTVSSMGASAFYGSPELDIWIAREKAPWYWTSWASDIKEIHWNYDGYDN